MAALSGEHWLRPVCVVTLVLLLSVIAGGYAWFNSNGTYLLRQAKLGEGESHVDG